MVGSVNMDTISLLYNFEANITSTNKRFTEMLESNFMDDMGQSEVVDRVAWKRRLSLMKIPEFLTIFIRKIL
jgi:phosphatidylserine/phosphatidylglycerophosphate/cardiolipin synthase-like enzyme